MSTPSRKSADALQELQNRPVAVVPTPRHLALPAGLTRAQARAHFGLPVDPDIVTYLGRLAREKDISILLEAAADGHGGLAATHLALAGPGRHRRALEREVRRLGLKDRVHFLGRVEPGDVATLLLATDVLAMPSITDTQSLVISEAASLGVPAVIRDPQLCLGELVVVDGVSGLTETPERSFEQSLRLLVESPELRAQLGIGAKDRVTKVGEDFGRRMTSLYISAADRVGEP